MSAPLGKSVVTFMLAILAGVAGAVLGWLVTGFAADAMLGLTGMSDINGGRAMVAFFTFAPFGAIAGLMLGIWLALRSRGGISFARLVGYAALVLVAIAAIGGGVLGVYYLTDDVLVRNGPPPQLNFELRLPPKGSLPAKLEGVKIDLETDKNTMPINWPPELRQDGDRPVIAGDVDVYFRTSTRSLVLRMPGEPDRIFFLKLAANPKGSVDFSPWQRVDYIDEHSDQPIKKAGPDAAYEIRYRVERND